MAVTTSDLATYLGIDAASIDTARAQMLIDDAVSDALTIVVVGSYATTPTEDNLPTGYEAVIRAAAGRQYQNSTGATTETVGPYSVSRPANSGAVLSPRERRKLLRLAGRGGAFGIDPTPADALVNVIDPLQPPDLEDTEDVDLNFGV